MRRLPAALLLLAALALLAAACGDSDEGAATTVPPPTTAPAPAPTTVPPPATTAPVVTTTAVTTTTAAPTTTLAPTTTTAAGFAAAEATLAAVLAACDDYSVGLGDVAHFDGSADDPTAGGEFTGEAAPGVFEFVDRDGTALLVDTNAGVVTGSEGPDGPAPRPYSFWCPPEAFPGTLDEGDPDALPPVVLEPDGLGVASFGAEAEAAIADLTTALGLPDADSGWIDSFSTFGTCPGAEVRVVRWDELEAYFTDSPAAVADYPDPGGPHFFSWRAATFVDDEPPSRGFATDDAISPGTPLGVLREAYGEAQVQVVYEDAFDIWFLDVAAAGLSGTVSGDTDNDVVESLQGGIGCGE